MPPGVSRSLTLKLPQPLYKPTSTRHYQHVQIDARKRRVTSHRSQTRHLGLYRLLRLRVSDQAYELIIIWCGFAGGRLDFQTKLPAKSEMSALMLLFISCAHSVANRGINHASYIMALPCKQLEHSVYKWHSRLRMERLNFFKHERAPTAPCTLIIKSHAAAITRHNSTNCVNLE